MIRLPHLETNVTMRCQLSCRSCNHFVPMLRKQPRDITPAQMRRDLAKLGKVAHSKAYALLGGEPLLHKKILELMEVGIGSGIADVLEIWTNGLLLEEQPKEFWELAQKIVLSAYPGKMDDKSVAWVKCKCLENGVQLEIKDARSLNYYTALLTRPKSPEAAARAYRDCWYRTYTYSVDAGHFYRCCTTPFIPEMVLGLPRETDGLSLEGITEEKLLAYMMQAETPAACTVCGMAVNANHAWLEVKDPREWLEQSHG